MVDLNNKDDKEYWLKWRETRVEMYPTILAFLVRVVCQMKRDGVEVTNTALIGKLGKGMASFVNTMLPELQKLGVLSDGITNDSDLCRCDFQSDYPAWIYVTGMFNIPRTINALKSNAEFAALLNRPHQIGMREETLPSVDDEVNVDSEMNDDHHKNRYGVIYKATCKVNGKCYVGQTVDFVARKQGHLNEAIRGGGHLFHEAIRSYGPESFEWEVIDSASSAKELTDLEYLHIVDENSYDPGGYNDRESWTYYQRHEKIRLKTRLILRENGVARFNEIVSSASVRHGDLEVLWDRVAKDLGARTIKLSGSSRKMMVVKRF